jgi:hypothetical protein
MKKTAVEWLVDRLDKMGYIYAPAFAHAILDQEIQRAKEMEYEQALEFWKGGIKCTESGGKSFDQYYNQTFKPRNHD